MAKTTVVSDLQGDVTNLMELVPLNQIRWLNVNIAREKMRDSNDSGLRKMIQSMLPPNGGWLQNKGTVAVIDIAVAEAIGLDPYNEANWYVPDPVTVNTWDEDGKAKKIEITKAQVQQDYEIIYSDPTAVTKVAIDGFHRFMSWMMRTAASPEFTVDIPIVPIETVKVTTKDEFYDRQRGDNRRAAIIQRSIWEILQDALEVLRKPRSGEKMLWCAPKGEISVCEGNRNLAMGLYAASMCHLKIPTADLNDGNGEQPFDAIKTLRNSGWKPDQRFRNALMKFLKEQCGTEEKLMNVFSKQEIRDKVARFIKGGPNPPAVKACWVDAFQTATSAIELDQFRQACKDGNLDLACKLLLDIDKMLLLATGKKPRRPMDATRGDDPANYGPDGYQEPDENTDESENPTDQD